MSYNTRLIKDVRVWDLKGNCLNVDNFNRVINKITELEHYAEENPSELSYHFLLGSTDEDLQNNISVATEIGLNNRVTCKVSGTLYGVYYDLLGIYHDGTIYTINEEFDVNSNTGEITLIYEDDNTTAIPLNYGDSMSDVDKARNLEILTKMSIYSIFLCRIDYGYGTAQFNTSTGGTATIITSQGIAVKYIIAADGGVTKDVEKNLFA